MRWSGLLLLLLVSVLASPLAAQGDRRGVRSHRPAPRVVPRSVPRSRDFRPPTRTPTPHITPRRIDTPSRPAPRTRVYTPPVRSTPDRVSGRTRVYSPPSRVPTRSRFDTRRYPDRHYPDRARTRVTPDRSPSRVRADTSRSRVRIETTPARPDVSSHYRVPERRTTTPDRRTLDRPRYGESRRDLRSPVYVPPSTADRSGSRVRVTERYSAPAPARVSPSPADQHRTTLRDLYRRVPDTSHLARPDSGQVAGRGRIPESYGSRYRTRSDSARDLARGRDESRVRRGSDRGHVRTDRGDRLMPRRTRDNAGSALAADRYATPAMKHRRSKPNDDPRGDGRDYRRSDHRDFPRVLSSDVRLSARTPSLNTGQPASNARPTPSPSHLSTWGYGSSWGRGGRRLYGYGHRHGRYGFYGNLGFYGPRFCYYGGLGWRSKYLSLSFCFGTLPGWCSGWGYYAFPYYYGSWWPRAYYGYTSSFCSSWNGYYPWRSCWYWPRSYYCPTVYVSYYGAGDPGYTYGEGEYYRATSTGGVTVTEAPVEAPAEGASAAASEEAPGTEKVSAGAGTAPSPALRTRSSLAEKHVGLGDFYFHEGRFAEAAESYLRALAYAPDDGTIHFVLADALFAIGDYHYAAFMVGKGLRLEPDLALADTDKRSFYGDASDFDHQLADLREYIGKQPYDAAAYLLLGYNLKFSRQPELARAALRKALEIDPGNQAAKLLLDGLDHAAAPKPADSTEKAGAEKAGAEKAGAEKAGAEKAGAEKAGAEKAGAEKAGAEKAGAEKAGAGKAGAGKAGAEGPTIK